MRLSAPRAEHDERRLALGEKAARGGLAQAAAGAGNDDGFSGDVIAHVFVFCFV